jgi:MoaA/NifB/PqqE/SkfB family radical SAM enzyme
MPKICPYPFSRIEYNSNYYIPCCFDWLTDEYHKLDHTNSDKWNSKAAIELRKRILKNDYSLCKRDYCQIKLRDTDENHVRTTDCDLDKQRLDLIANGTVNFTGPTSVSITADRRCNLACESCRPEKVVTLSADDKKNLELTKQQLSKHANTIKIIKMVGDGEVFYSPYLSKFLKQLSPATYPSLEKVSLLTNGTLLSEANYERHKPGINYVQEISVSIDAGNQETYDQVRGGDWQQLMKNLTFMADLRAKGIIKKLSISFVVRKKNYLTMKEFARLGLELKTDQVIFSAFHPWHNIRDHVDYDDQAIHLESHSEHNKLVTQINSVKKDYPNVEFKFHYTNQEALPQ